MGELSWGSLSFVLFLVYDLNQLYWKRRVLQPLFLLGCLFLAGATASLYLKTGPSMTLTFPLPLFMGGMTLLSLLGWAYSLFGALPFGRTYLPLAGPGQLQDRGMYAMSRHPGAVWMLLFYLFFWLTTGRPLIFWAGVVFGSLNVLYVWIQDWLIFPKSIEGYEVYRERVPFLFPSSQSIQAGLDTLKNPRGDQ